MNDWFHLKSEKYPEGVMGLSDNVFEPISMNDIVSKLRQENENVTPNTISDVLFDLLDIRLQDALEIVKENISAISERVSKNGVTVNEDTEHLEVDGHDGTWYTINSTIYRGHEFFLMEHEKFGDEVACVAVDERGVLVAEDLWDGFDDGFREATDEYIKDRKFKWIALVKENDFND